MLLKLARSSFLLFGLPLLLGAVGGLGRPGIDLAPLYFASEILLAYLALRSAGPIRAALVGVAWGAGLFAVISLGTLSWGPIVPSALTVIGIGLYALPLALWSWGASRLFTGPRLFVATAAAWSLWLGLGDLLRFPLKESAFSLVASAPLLAAGARLVGSNWLSGLLTATSVGIACALARARDQTRAKRVLAATWVFLSGFGILAALAALAQVTAQDARRTIEVGVPQINASSDYYGSRLLQPKIASEFDARFERLLGGLNGVDLLVMTEGFDGRFGLMLPTVLGKWQRYAEARKQAVLFTSYTVEPNGWKGNAVAGISESGRIAAVHRKVDLAFYGERPLAAGTHYEILPLRPDLTVGASICLESVLQNAPYTMTRAGANLLTVSTSDTTFGSNVTSFEHLAATQLRAVETGRDIVWASNGGPSGVIDRWGEFEAAAPLRKIAAARMTASLYDDATFYLRHSNALIVLAILVLGGALATLGSRDQRRAELARAAAVGDGGLLWLTATRASLLTLACGVACVAIVVSGPAWVELSRGDAKRALASVRAAFTPPLAFAPPDAFARFRTPPDQTARGALAYFLTYYGIETTAADLPTPAQTPTTLGALQSYLQTQFRFSTWAMPLVQNALPRVAALVQLRDGSFGVFTAPTGEGRPTLLSPRDGVSRALSDAQIRTLLQPALLIPSAQQ